jgi:transposase-like protein
MTKKTSTKYSPEVRERAVRMVFEHQGEHASQWTAIGSIAAKIGCTAETLRGWMRQAERDQGLRAGTTTDERERIMALEREVRELRQANEIPCRGLGVFCTGGARPPVQAMIAFIDDHRDTYGVEPICRVLPIAPSTYPPADPGLRPPTDGRRKGQDGDRPLSQTLRGTRDIRLPVWPTEINSGCSIGPLTFIGASTPWQKRSTASTRPR